MQVFYDETRLSGRLVDSAFVRDYFMISPFQRDCSFNQSMVKVEVEALHPHFYLIFQKVKDGVDYKNIGVFYFLYDKIFTASSVKQLVHTKVNNINAYLRDILDEVIAQVDKESLAVRWSQEDSGVSKETDLEEMQVLDCYLYE